jgi:hypothetical protein
MPGLADEIKRHPIVTFFVLPYVITWSLVPFRSSERPDRSSPLLSLHRWPEAAPG